MFRMRLPTEEIKRWRLEENEENWRKLPTEEMKTWRGLFVLFYFVGKRDIDGRLTSAQTALMLQEEAIRRGERERKLMSDKVNNLEHSLATVELDKAQLHVREIFGITMFSFLL